MHFNHSHNNKIILLNKHTPHTHIIIHCTCTISLSLFLPFPLSFCFYTFLFLFLFFVSSPLLSPLLSQATEPELLGPALHQKVSKLYQRHRYGRCIMTTTHIHIQSHVYTMLCVIHLHNYSNVIIVAFLEQCQLQRLN